MKKWLMICSLWGYLLISTLAAQAQPPPIPKPQSVFVGIYLNNIVSLEIKQNVYWFDFYVWFRWRGSIDPTETFEFTNAHEQWGSTINPITEEVKDLPDGWKLKQFHIEQKFHNKFFFQHYPLDAHELVIQIEDRRHTNQELLYIPEPTIHYNPHILIPGWKIAGQQFDVRQTGYPTDFGEFKPTKRETYSQFHYALKIQRPQLTHLFKLLLPVLIILTIVGFIFLMPLEYYDTRIGTAITALLSLIALQIVISDSLPPVGYIILSDKIYYFSYILILFCIMETVYAHQVAKNNALRARKLDKIGMLSIFLGTPVIIILLLSVVR